MDEIEEAQASLEQAKEQLKAAVQKARHQGRTWAEVGAALGMTRQAAFKRFGEATNPADGRKITGAPMSVEKIRSITEQVFDHISSGDYASLEELMHPSTRQELPESLVSETWARVLAEVGEKQSYSDTHVVLPAGERIEEDEQLLGTVVGVTTLNCEAGEMMGRVAVDDQQRVVGLLLVSPDHSPLPF